MVLVENLPKSGIDLSTIDTYELFPFHAVFIDEFPSYIHNDGSIVIFFEVIELDSAFFQLLIDLLPVKSTIQIYKLKGSGALTDQYFGCIKVSMDYGRLKLSLSNLMKMIFNGAEYITSEINEQTRSNYERIKLILSDKCRIVQVTDNALYKFLIDCSVNGSIAPHPTLIPKCNMSVVLTGKSRCSSIISVNDMSGTKEDLDEILPSNGSILQIAIIYKPASTHNQSIHEYFNHINSIVSASSTDDNAKRLVHSSGQYCLTNFSFIINSNSISELDMCASEITKVLMSKGIDPYNYSNSTNTHYVACFPGNGDKTCNFHSCYQEITKQYISRFFEL